MLFFTNKVISAELAFTQWESESTSGTITGTCDLIQPREGPPNQHAVSPDLWNLLSGVENAGGKIQLQVNLPYTFLHKCKALKAARHYPTCLLCKWQYLGVQLPWERRMNFVLRSLRGHLSHYLLWMLFGVQTFGFYPHQKRPNEIKPKPWEQVVYIPLGRGCSEHRRKWPTSQLPSSSALEPHSMELLFFF